MKICLFSRNDPVKMRGGLETYLAYLTRYLMERGHDVIFVCPSPAGKISRSLTRNILFRILRLDMGEMYDSCRLAFDVRKVDADIYHGQAQHPFAFSVFRRIGISQRKPFVSTAHGSTWGLAKSSLGATMQTRLVTSKMEKVTFNASDMVICVSDSTRSELIAGYGVSPSHTCVIHNGVDPSKYIEKDSAKRVLDMPPGAFVTTLFARGGPRKGAQVSARILEGLIDQFSPTPGVFVHVILDRPAPVQFSSIPLPRGWVLYESPSDQLMLTLLSASDVFVFPTPYEGHSVILLEAMAARNVILTSDIQPNVETIQDGVSGYTLDLVDIDKWLRHLKQLYIDKALVRSMQDRAFRRVRERFLAEDMCKKTESLYERML